MNGNELLINAIRGHIKSRIECDAKAFGKFEQQPFNPYQIIEQGMLAILDDYERIMGTPMCETCLGRYLDRKKTKIN